LAADAFEHGNQIFRIRVTGLQLKRVLQVCCRFVERSPSVKNRSQAEISRKVVRIDLEGMAEC